MEAYLAGITGELAEQLTEGKPCPVCGSISHPHKAIKVDNSITKVMVDVPQDRKSTFEPQVVKKRQKDISDIDQKIISMSYTILSVIMESLESWQLTSFLVLR